MLNTTNPKSTSSRNPKLILFLMLIVLGLPMLFAYVLIQKGNAYHFRLNNHGDLIIPPVNIAKLSFYDLNTKFPYTGDMLLGKWWLVYVGPSKCQQSCHPLLYNMRQIRTALGKDAKRLDRLFLAHPQCQQSVCQSYLNENYPEMAKARLLPSAYNFLFANIGNHEARNTIGEIYIIDPKGNLMMHYDIDEEPKSILSDLKRLLKISKIG